jgi:hypothetical protein
MALSSAIQFSLRELMLFVTFLCVALASIMSSGSAMPLVLLNALLLAFAVLVSGPTVYGWMFAGVLIVPLIFIDALAAVGGRSIDLWQEMTPDIWIAICLGAVCGCLVGLRNSGRELLPMIILSLAMIDLFWLILPRVQ